MTSQKNDRSSHFQDKTGFYFLFYQTPAVLRKYYSSPVIEQILAKKFIILNISWSPNMGIIWVRYTASYTTNGLHSRSSNIHRLEIMIFEPQLQLDQYLF